MRQHEKQERSLERLSVSLVRNLQNGGLTKDPDVVAWINELEANGRISMHAVMTSSFSRELLRIERVDRLIMAAEGRRNAVLREIERRRDIAFARSLRGAIQKVEDAEFEVIEPQAIPPTNNDSQNAA